MIRSMTSTQVTASSSLEAIAAAADAAARAALHTLNLPGRQRRSERAQKARPKFPHATAKTTVTGKPQVTVFAPDFCLAPCQDQDRQEGGNRPRMRDRGPWNRAPPPPRHAGPHHALTQPGNRLRCTHGTQTPQHPSKHETPKVRGVGPEQPAKQLGDQRQPAAYRILGYDLHGNMTAMPQLQQMQWDFDDHLYLTCRRAVDVADSAGTLHQGQQTYYVYDAAGERVRKTTVSAAGVTLHECFYIGRYQVYRRYGRRGMSR